MSSSKKKRITISATTEGLERAEKALMRMGYDTKTNFAQSTFISRSVVTNFFLQRKVQIDTLKRICEKLELDWIEIADLGVAVMPTTKGDMALVEEGNETSSVSTAPTKRITIVDPDSKITKAVITLEGNPDAVKSRMHLEAILKVYGGDTIIIEEIRSGSIKVSISGSSDDIERLKSRIESGEIGEIDGFSVENIEVTETYSKWDLIEDIINHSIVRGNLSNSDLSEADLSGADLSGADLRKTDLSDSDLSGADLSDAILIVANLSRANLSRANLSGAYSCEANLSRTNLSGANLSRANLSGANLSGANLIEVNMSKANVENAWFSSDSPGILAIKPELIERGAIFDDSTGDRSEILTRV